MCIIFTRVSQMKKSDIHASSSNKHLGVFQNLDNDKARRKVALKSYEAYSSLVVDFKSTNLNTRYPFFLFYYLWEYQKGRCFYCERSLYKDTIVLSHDLGHNCAIRRLDDNISKCNRPIVDESISLSRQQLIFEEDFNEDKPIDLCNQIQYFSLIHHRCNSSLASGTCRNCKKVCDNIFCHLSLLEEVESIVDRRFCKFDNFFV